MNMLFDLRGEPVADDVEYLADRKNEDGSYTVFFDTKEDVAALIEELSSTENAPKEQLQPNYWTNASCKRLGARSCKGECAGGTCQQRSDGSFTFCRCSSDKVK